MRRPQTPVTAAVLAAAFAIVGGGDDGSASTPTPTPAIFSSVTD